VDALKRILSFLTVATLLTASVAYADSPNPKRARAEALMKEGVALDAKGQKTEALARFRAAYDAFPTPNILFAVGMAERDVGESLSAIRHLREAMKKETLDPQYAEKGKGYIRELEAKLGRVVLKAPAGTTLRIDDVTYEGSLQEPIDLDVGAHTLLASRDAKEQKVTVTSAAGKEETVTISFEPPPASAPPPAPLASAPPVAPPTEPHAGGWSTGKIVLVAGLGAGAVAGAVAAVVFHGSATSAVDDAKALPPTGDCRGSTTPDCKRAADLQSDRDKADTLTTVSLVATGAFAAGAIAVALLVPWRRQESARVTPIVGPGYGGASLVMGF
jgi:hypothetical protein